MKSLIIVGKCKCFLFQFVKIHLPTAVQQKGNSTNPTKKLIADFMIHF